MTYYKHSLYPSKSTPLGYNIVKTFRTFYGYTQRDVEDATGIHQTRLSSLESMNVDKLAKSLTVEEIEKLNSFFNSSPYGVKNSFYESVLYHVVEKHKRVNTAQKKTKGE